MTYVAGVPLLRPRTNGPTGTAHPSPAPFVRNMEPTASHDARDAMTSPADVQAIRHTAIN